MYFRILRVNNTESAQLLRLNWEKDQRYLVNNEFSLNKSNENERRSMKSFSRILIYRKPKPESMKYNIWTTVIDKNINFRYYALKLKGSTWAISFNSNWKGYMHMCTYNPKLPTVQPFLYGYSLNIFWNLCSPLIEPFSRQN